MSECVCMSINPGLTINPLALIIFFALLLFSVPILDILSLIIPISDLKLGLLVPSIIVPFFIIMSKFI